MAKTTRGYTMSLSIEIDGKKVQAQQGDMIIEAADAANVYIPRFCYHKKLSIAANCRMCLVEVEGGRKAMPACATPISDGMKVNTKSTMAQEAQKAVMEFLLINHPLDCPICDQGGECELQDLTMAYGKDSSRFDEGKRVVKDQNLGSLIATEMTRCIHCTRCVRFGDEIAGQRELGGIGRGTDTEIGTYVEQMMTSEVSGNVIDLCPVGALTSKPYRFTARSWEMLQRDSIAPHDCLGSNIHVHCRRTAYGNEQNVMRVVPKENEAINEAWLSDRDRFSYLGLNEKHRLTTPKIKQNGVWHEVDWQTALNFVTEAFEKIKAHDGVDQLAAMTYVNSTVEEYYLLQKLMRALGSNHIDHRIRQQDFRDDSSMPLMPTLGMGIDEIETKDAILLVGSDIRREQPLAAVRVRKAFLNDAWVGAINPLDYEFNFKLQNKAITGTAQLVPMLAQVAKFILQDKQQTVPEKLLAITISEEASALAQALINADQPCLILGAQSVQHANSHDIKFLAHLIADCLACPCGMLTEGANTQGAWLAGAVPHRTLAGELVVNAGDHAKALFEKPRQGYLLLNVEPECDSRFAAQAHDALKAAACVVAMTPFSSEAMNDYADVLLPIAPFSETSGTFINVTGQWQSFTAVEEPFKQTRPAWKVLVTLAKLLNIDGFDYESTLDVLNQVKLATDHANQKPLNYAVKALQSIEPLKADIHQIIEWHMYRTDALVRRSEPLQDFVEDTTKTLRVNKSTKDHLPLNIIANREIVLDERVPNEHVLLMGA